MASDGFDLPATLVEVAAHRLRDAILSGALEPGEKIVEEQLCADSASAGRRCARRCGCSPSRVWSSICRAAARGSPSGRPPTSCSCSSCGRCWNGMPSRARCRCADPRHALRAGARRARRDARAPTDDLERDDAHRRFHAAVVGLAANRQLDIALAPILLKLQLPMATNLREEARQHRAGDGIERHGDPGRPGDQRPGRRASRPCEDHGHLHYLDLPGCSRSLTRATHSRTATAIILSTIDSYGS